MTTASLASVGCLRAASAARASCPPAPKTFQTYLQAAAEARSGRLDQQPGYLRLGAGQAVTLRANEPGVLRIAQGRVWVTFDGVAPQQAGIASGDYFVSRGEELPLLSGQSILVEPFSVGDGASVYFSWEPLAPPRAERALRAARWALI